MHLTHNCPRGLFLLRRHQSPLFRVTSSQNCLECNAQPTGDDQLAHSDPFWAQDRYFQSSFCPSLWSVMQVRVVQHWAGERSQLISARKAPLCSAGVPCVSREELMECAGRAALSGHCTAQVPARQGQDTHGSRHTLLSHTDNLLTWKAALGTCLLDFGSCACAG